MTLRPWQLASDEVQLSTWRQALEVAKGNITRAAAELDIHRSQASRFMKKFDLYEFAGQSDVDSCCAFHIRHASFRLCR